MSYHGKGQGHGRWNRNEGRGRTKPIVGEKAREVLENISDDSEIIKSFRGYATELDLKHDKYERIVKISRDITIESKRIIFLLHSADKESKKASVMEDAQVRLSNLDKTSFKNIAKELEGEDPYQFLRAYSPGLQEYIEALTFYNYLKSFSLCHWKDIQKNLTYPHLPEDSVLVSEETEQSGNQEIVNRRALMTVVPPLDFALGIADLTGELMRKCINSLGTGDTVSCHQTCSFVREIYRGFLKVGHTGRDMGQKIHVLRTSLAKMESSCYELAVRGTEVPTHLLAETISIRAHGEDFKDEDEGFY